MCSRCRAGNQPPDVMRCNATLHSWSRRAEHTSACTRRACRRRCRRRRRRLFLTKQKHSLVPIHDLIIDMALERVRGGHAIEYQSEFRHASVTSSMTVIQKPKHVAQDLRVSQTAKHGHLEHFLPGLSLFAVFSSARR